MVSLLEHAIPSSMDGRAQPLMYWLPAERNKKVPVVVSLHTWSGDYRQMDHSDPCFKEASRRGWIYLQPNFRGPNWTPEGCGSRLATRDILDAVDWSLRNSFADPDRVYIVGASGGGHMGMLMVSRFPDRFTAASVWCGISDVRAWRLFHTHGNEIGRYAEHIDKAVGGPPGSSEEVERQLRDRSSVGFIQNAAGVAIDFNHGSYDGHRGSVPAEQTIRAFNILAEAVQAAPVSESEIRELWETGQLRHPGPHDTAADPWYGRAIRLRRWAGKSRLTIFDGGHEIFAQAAFHWLACHTRAGVIDDPNPPKANAAEFTESSWSQVGH